MQPKGLTLDTTIIFAVVAATIGGLSIGTQGVFINIIGQNVGMIRVGFLVHFMGAVVGGVILASMMGIRGDGLGLDLSGKLWIFALVTGITGMITLPSVAYSFPRIGQVAGQAALISGQMLIGLLIDASGAAGTTIPIDLRRLSGIVLLGVAIYLLLPSED